MLASYAGCHKRSAPPQEDTCPDYMLKAEECLKAEEARVGHYLHLNSKGKLLLEVETEVLAKYEVQLLEKEHSGCAALLRDDKVRLSHLWWLMLSMLVNEVGFVQQVPASRSGLKFSSELPCALQAGHAISAGWHARLQRRQCSA